MTTKRSWFEAGYDEGFAGEEERVPEGYHVRVNYRRGWAQGNTDRFCAANGYKVIGRVDPALAR